MHIVLLQKTAIFFFCCALAGSVRGGDFPERTANAFEEVQAQALRLAKLAGGAEQILLVFDIDNTLLAMKQDLSIDQWFNWQQTLPEGDWRRVGDFPELLRVQRFLYAISSMRPTEPGLQPKIVKRLQKTGFKTLLLTSRAYDVRDATRRELLANGYDFRKSSMSPSGFAGPYVPYDVTDIEKSGITYDEAHKWLTDSNNADHLQDPREVSYNEGVYMVAGQNKGVMPRMLLHKANSVGKYRHIVFVDDNPENTRDVRDAFENQRVNIVTFRYAREDANVQRFSENRSCEKHFAALALQQIREALNSTNVSKQNPPIDELSTPAHFSSSPQVEHDAYELMPLQKLVPAR